MQLSDEDEQCVLKGCLVAALQQQLDTESTRRQQSDTLNQENQVKVQEFHEFQLQHVRIKSQIQVTDPSLCSCFVLSRSVLCLITVNKNESECVLPVYCQHIYCLLNVLRLRADCVLIAC